MSAGTEYLDPYRRAVRANADLFKALLWASPQSQELRFAALARSCPFAGLDVLDLGCGRADFLDYLLAGRVAPAHYTGIEAVPELVAAARGKGRAQALIVEDDFVQRPGRMLVGADVVVCCGSLNTLGREQFFQTLRVAFDATSQWLAFNFLCSGKLAAVDWLTWHSRDKVLEFAGGLTSSVTVDDGYLEGDCTMILGKGSENALGFGGQV